MVFLLVGRPACVIVLGVGAVLSSLVCSGAGIRNLEGVANRLDKVRPDFWQDINSFLIILAVERRSTISRKKEHSLNIAEEKQHV